MRKEQGRQSDASFANFVEIAYASSSEADYQLLLARGVGYLEPTQYDTLATELAEIRKMLAALRRTPRMGGAPERLRRRRRFPLIANR